jgi:hypothetical protein
MDYTKKLTTKLEAGNNYVYPVTLNKQSLTVGSASIADWDNVEVKDAVSMKYQAYKTITNKADVQKYDYLMSDGTFMRVPSEYISDFISAKGGDIAGVVFWTKAENTGCPDLTTDKELAKLGYTNGLVVSANAGILTKWIESVDFELGVTTDNLNALNGYSNTLALKKYNDGNPTYPVLAVSVFAGEKDITGTSGWYLPSTREGVYLLGGTTIVYDYYFSGDASEIDKYLTNKIEENGIWTSVEYNDKSSYCVGIWNGKGGIGAYYKILSNRYYSRPICAF